MVNPIHKTFAASRDPVFLSKSNKEELSRWREDAMEIQRNYHIRIDSKKHFFIRETIVSMDIDGQ